MKFRHGNIELEVPEEVYYPAEDSFLLADVIEDADIKGKKVIDVGCGSGFLSILCALRGADVAAVDISEEAVETSRLNAATNGVKIDAKLSDLFEKINGKYDVIIFNPPYLPKEEGEEGHATYTGGATGREVIERFILHCREHLNEGGRIFLLASSLTDMNKVIALLNNNGLFVKIVAKEKLDWEELFVIESILS